MRQRGPRKRERRDTVPPLFLKRRFCLREGNVPTADVAEGSEHDLRGGLASWTRTEGPGGEEGNSNAPGSSGRLVVRQAMAGVLERNRMWRSLRAAVQKRELWYGRGKPWPARG